VDWITEHWLDALGWGGSALLIFSLLQSRVLRLRVLNLMACLILVVFNGLLGIWPMVAMNIVLSLINIWFIVSLLRDSDRDAAYQVLEVGAADAYLRHVLGFHRADIAHTHPDFRTEQLEAPGVTAYLVEKGAETVGVVVMRAHGDTANVLLDYVTPRFRDFTPGRFVWRQSGLLRERGFRRVVAPPNVVGAKEYYGRIGFAREASSWVLEL
jgi:hypothetical protein